MAAQSKESEAGSRHTPGPWTVRHINGSNFAVQEFEIRGECEGKPHIFPIFNKDRSAIDGAHIFCSPEDANLIAAAPELLEALTRLYKETADYIAINNLGDVHHNQSMQMARDAIAKAKGERP